MKNFTKTILLVFLFTTPFLVASESLDARMKYYNKLFNQIGEKRVGIPNNKIGRLKNPFVIQKKEINILNEDIKVISKPKYILNGTFNNRAKINNIWYIKNSQIGEFRLVSIKTNSVIIQNEHSKKELFIRKNNVNKIKFSSK